MRIDDHMNRNALSMVLVTLQFALLAVLASLAAPNMIAGRTPALAWAIIAGGLLLRIWSLSSNHPGNFNIRPVPRANGELVQTGPYRWIRHPMYTSLIGCNLGCAWVSNSGIGWLSLTCLAVVLAVKARFEERWILGTHPQYATYQTRTWRFIPWMY